MRHQRCRTCIRCGLTQDAASDAVARALVRVYFFFFSRICADAARFVPNRLRFVPNRLQFAPNQADSAKIGPYRPYQVVSASDRYGRNKPETAEIGRKRPKLALKLAGAAEILTSDVFFAFFFLCFMNQVY